ncbi:hypothetical protein GUJ93_ZPchr0007g5537 [Zizania palustris]|uniref:Uncharacterized protein n=1 Tax=Zizania palustris TaxID=103762 RepID=A0A8J5TG81_ZIZPA|nr:hypothetical protein GUJ93_ZPchr0007g5537 [Zizania palustris]
MPVGLAPDRPDATSAGPPAIASIATTTRTRFRAPAGLGSLCQDAASERSPANTRRRPGRRHPGLRLGEDKPVCPFGFEVFTACPLAADATSLLAADSPLPARRRFFACPLVVDSPPSLSTVLPSCPT